MWQHKWSALIEKVKVLHSPDDEARLLNDLAAGEKPRVLGFVNAHAMNTVTVDDGFFDALVGADVLLRDGSGMATLYRSLERDPGLNMNGTDFIPKLLHAYRGRRVALWGTREPFLGMAAARCELEFGVKLVSVEGGFEDEQTYCRLQREAMPDLIVLGMGMPRQECLARKLSAASPGEPLIVCGGAILDFLGGKVRRAPRWMRRSGIEWLYRLSREPIRLFRRYVYGNVAFVVKLHAWRRETTVSK